MRRFALCTLLFSSNLFRFEFLCFRGFLFATCGHRCAKLKCMRTCNRACVATKIPKEFVRAALKKTFFLRTHTAMTMRPRAQQNRKLIAKKYQRAISLVWKKFQSAWISGAPATLHFAILLRGTRPIGTALMNDINVSDAFCGPKWSPGLSKSAERSIHAEARAAQRSFVRKTSGTSSRRKARRKTVGVANGVVVCRITNAGTLALSKPCAECVGILARCNIRFVVYSVTGGHWDKKSIKQLQNDPSVKKTRLKTVWRREMAV